MSKFKIKDSGNRQKFETGAQRDIQEGKGRYDLLPTYALERIAQHFENGALKYGENNWKLGIPLKRFMDSGLRHAFKFLRGDRDEDHLTAAIWNFMCLLETETMIQNKQLPESLNDLPKGKNGKNQT